MKMDSGRETALDRIYELIENNMVVIGSTAIEDKLQIGVCKISFVEINGYRGDYSVYEGCWN